MLLREFQEKDFITDRDVLKAKKTILGYKSDMDHMSGAIYWYKVNDTNAEPLYATPSWNGEWGIIPFDGPDGEDYGKIDFTKTKYIGNHKLQLKLYFEVVRIALVKLEKDYNNKK
jgi:hypothetical protein